MDYICIDGKKQKVYQVRAGLLTPESEVYMLGKEIKGDQMIEIPCSDEVRRNCQHKTVGIVDQYRKICFNCGYRTFKPHEKIKEQKPTLEELEKLIIDKLEFREVDDYPEHSDWVRFNSGIHVFDPKHLAKAIMLLLDSKGKEIKEERGQSQRLMDLWTHINQGLPANDIRSLDQKIERVMQTLLNFFEEGEK